MTKAMQLGAQAETLACAFLSQQGLTIITRNYRCAYGEIDLIMQEKDSLIFVEVRMRSNQRYGTGLETITAHKQRKLIKAAKHYLMQQSLVFSGSCRFDAVEILPSKQSPIWIKNAFQVHY